MPKIDNQMLEIYNQSIKNDSACGKTISKEEAHKLIERAEQLNNTRQSSFSYKKEKSGNKYLRTLMQQNPQNFSLASIKMINNFLTTGQIFNDSDYDSDDSSYERHECNEHESSSDEHSSSSHHNNISSYNRSIPNIVISPSYHQPSLNNTTQPSINLATPHQPATRTISHHEYPSSNTNSMQPSVTNNHQPINPSENRHDITLSNTNNNQPITRTISHHEHPSSNTNSMQPSITISSNNAEPSLTVSDHNATINRSNVGFSPILGADNREINRAQGKLVIDFKSYPTWFCHWWPLQETKPGGDPVNNLYAPGGCLEKLDKVTGKNARMYEFTHNRKAYNEGKKYAWWGHCNNSAEAACILKQPKHAVTIKGIDGSDVTFSTMDIQGLLVKMTPSLIARVDFRGERFNSSRDDPSDPKPHVFLDVLKEWSKDKIPFVLDLDNKEQVWNFPYDKAQVFESDRSPEGFSLPSNVAANKTKFYHIEMSGTGFDRQRRVYECYIEWDDHNQVKSSNWIKTDNSHNNPDFMWRPHALGDIMNKETWQFKGQPSNPEVDPQCIYNIYMQSLA